MRSRRRCKNLDEAWTILTRIFFEPRLEQIEHFSVRTKVSIRFIGAPTRKIALTPCFMTAVQAFPIDRNSLEGGTLLKLWRTALWLMRSKPRRESVGAKPCRCWALLDYCPWLAAHPQQPNRQQISRCKAAQQVMRLFSVRRKSLTSRWERSTSSIRKTLIHPSRASSLPQDAAAAAAAAAAAPEAAAAEAAAAPEAAGEVAAGAAAVAGAAAAAVAVCHGAAAATARPAVTLTDVRTGLSCQPGPPLLFADKGTS
jgi:hypothetical protein